MYATVEFANGFLSMELWSDAWFASPEPLREKALGKATRIIDTIRYKGEKTDPVQVGEFPRNGETVIPADIASACSYIALALIEGKIPELEYGNARVESDSLASGKISYQTNNTPKHMLYGVPSYDAWGLLVKYVDLASTISLVRVS